MKDDSFDCTLIAHLRIFLLFYRLLYCLILPENRLFFGIWKVVEIDEGNRFLPTQRFAELVQQSDNYFVIATREKLPMLPYSIKEIYGFRESGKFRHTKQKYNEIYHLYGEISNSDSIEPEYVITEDSNSGFDFFSSLSAEKHINCISANGKSNIIKRLQEEKICGTVLVIVDGAAFGSEMRDVSKYLEAEKNIVLYAPESFEWLLLASNTIPHLNVSAILEQPENYIDSAKYISWERYFTDLLIDSTKDSPLWRYAKKKLPAIYSSPKVIKTVKKVMKLIVWD